MAQLECQSQGGPELKVKRTILLLIFVLMLGGIYPAAAEEEEQGVFISRVTFGNVHVNQSTTYTVQVIDRSVSPDEDTSGLVPVDAEVTVSMMRGSHMLAQALERTDQGYEGTITFPEQGEWAIMVRAVGQNDFAGFEDELEMSLNVQEADQSLSFIWGGAMALFALATIYVLLRIRRLMQAGKK